ncbi:hypothetical protein CLG96_04975 [Sphingomonas oleivorans]|uniref:Phosphodiester glycosidase domain-containing protein n=1 Tax=Sphingomonas oleivorans TaxID=1735121 RepID=A0A2T5G2S4_9SPHN|nr:phosphodiester glycosidase family protein [Sphingomonas oleivorans]PTQ13445.1 hypothetical protein CLG96_04975 [Sphingomonas oleivorans]
MSLAYFRSRRALALCLGLFAVSPAAAGLPDTPFPLGREGLAETRVSEALAPGLAYHRIARGAVDPQARWTVSAGIARTSAEREQAAACLKAAGLPPRYSAYRAPGTRPLPYDEFSGGSFASEEAARTAFAAVPASPCHLAARHMASLPQDRDGPWLLHILEIRPTVFRGRLVSALAQDKVAGKEQSSSIARRHKALAAINGGFFAMKEEEGIAGEPAGIAMVAGRIHSEPTRGRPYLLLRDERPVAAQIVMRQASHPIRVRWADGSSSRIDGVDRTPGMIRNCGLAGAHPTSRPAHDMTCTKADELIAITDQAGFVPTQAKGYALLLGADGAIRPVTGTASPATGETLLIATGRRAAELSRKAQANRSARIDLSYRAIAPGVEPQRLDRLYAVNGAPLLLRHGRAVRRENREGWPMDLKIDRTEATHVHDWIVRRNPRTAAGIAADGTIYLLVADGRLFAGGDPEPSVPSAGLTIEELRAVMRHLGARDAINLDGGGSSTLVLRSATVNHPSDKEGERPVGDAILLLD